jgi:ZIP family zinc transporter
MLPVVAILPFISTILGGFAALRLRHRLHPAMALAAGILVATALVNLLPEGMELIGGDDAALWAGIAAVIGYLVYSAVEVLVHEQSYEHGHRATDDPAEPHEHAIPPVAGARALGWVAPFGLIVHSFLDGLVIGLGFEAGPEIGSIVVLAVVFHDFADGLNLVTVAMAGGHGRRAALVLLGIDAVATVVGVAVSGLLPLSAEHLGLLLAAFGGAFIAIGAGHLMPESEHGQRGSAPSLAVLAAAGGIAVILVRVTLGGH